VLRIASTIHTITLVEQFRPSRRDGHSLGEGADALVDVPMRPGDVVGDDADQQ
jgi:hypothetical protein